MRAWAASGPSAKATEGGRGPDAAWDAPRVFLSENACLHAPPQSKPGLIGAYTGGARGACVVLRETRDHEVVASLSDDLMGSTGEPGRIGEMTLREFYRRNFGATFRQGAALVRYHCIVMTLGDLGALPDDMDLIVRIADAPDTRRLVDAASSLNNGVRMVLFQAGTRGEATAIRDADPKANVALVARDSRAVSVAAEFGAAGVIVPAVALSEDPALARALAAAQESSKVPLGVIVLVSGTAIEEQLMVQPPSWMSGVIADSMFLLPASWSKGRVVVDDRFAGRAPDTSRWSLGYARANPYCHVFQDDGVHIDLKPYDPPPPPTDELDRRLRRLELLARRALSETPTYSGGGAGLRHSLGQRFVAEADLISAQAALATVAELAVCNVDPGRHLPSWRPDGTPRLPELFHEKHSFFDTHGSPPYFGCEHDEDGGFRINWNLGFARDDNQYGRDCGDGHRLAVTLRLERRGAYFTGYVRDLEDSEPRNWLCVGAIRNDSLNPRVYLRCVGKRWQKPDPSRPGQRVTPPNHFTFKRVTVMSFDERSGVIATH